MPVLSFCSLLFQQSLCFLKQAMCEKWSAATHARAHPEPLLRQIRYLLVVRVIAG
jgi:hypothetical protein